MRRLNYLILALILLAGLSLRLNQYTQATSFWKDEVFLALNFLDRDIGEISKPLDNTQAAPLGFLHLSKLFEQAFGHSEKVLWLVALLSSIGLLVGCAPLYVKTLKWRDGLIATSIIALSSTLIIYTSQFKPYLSDAFVTLGLMGAFCWARSQNNTKAYALWIGVGVLALYFSYIAVFVIAGLGLWLIGEAIAKKSRNQIVGWVLSNSLLAILFLAAWVGSYSQLDSDGIFKDFWAHAMLPWDSSALAWLWINPQASLSFIFAGTPAVLAILLTLLGAAKLWSSTQRHLLAFLLPVALTYIAAAAHAYPVEGRLIIFWIPLLAPLIAVGIGSIYELVASKHKVSALAILGILVVSFVVEPITNTREANFQDLRSIAVITSSQAAPGDIVWVHPKANKLFEYYFRRYPLADGVELVYGKEDEAWGCYDSIKKLGQGKRVFVAAGEAVYSVNDLDLLQMQAKSDNTLRAIAQMPLTQTLQLDFSQRKAPTAPTQP